MVLGGGRWKYSDTGMGSGEKRMFRVQCLLIFEAFYPPGRADYTGAFLGCLKQGCIAIANMSNPFSAISCIQINHLIR
jgi:hypothetical protein